MIWANLYLYPLLTTLTLWGGLSLGLFWLNRRSPLTRRIVLLLALGMLMLAHHQIWIGRNDRSLWGIYRAFLASMVIWAWHELAFYSGVLTGPWRTTCPHQAHGIQRLRYALGTHLYHILAIGIDTLALWWLHRGATNQTGLVIFGLLWLLQLSAKLNVLLGIRNFTVDMMPEHMRYLGSFWNQRSYNLFFLISVTIASITTIILWVQIRTLFPITSAISQSFYAAVMTLGVLEHLLLVVPYSERRKTTTVEKPLPQRTDP